jgi:RNA polymerase sigma factor (sigma-70 family)
MSTQPGVVSPFAADLVTDAEDCDLVARALEGDRSGLETLLRRHQPWIYNVAFRMVMVPQDAEDVTQEVLIKVLTKLSTFDRGKAAFRTWLYRIVANHVINMRQRGYEAAISRIEDYYSLIARVPDQEPDSSPETQMAVADIRNACVMGVFLCLERQQRLAFVLAIAFEVTDAEGSEILGVSRAAFRQLLSRGRGRLHEYGQGNCGVMNPAAPCRCAKKAHAFMRDGVYDARRGMFAQEDAPRLADVVGEKMQRFDSEIYAEYARVVRGQPFYRPPEMTAWLRDLTQRPEFREIFDLEQAREGSAPPERR